MGWKKDDLKYYNTAFTRYTEPLEDGTRIFLNPLDLEDSVVISQYVGPLMKLFKKSTDGESIWKSDWSTFDETSASRMLSCVVFLNDVDDGGDLEFYNQKIKFKPKKGTIVIYPSYFTHLYKHHIPISSDKYIINMYGVPVF